MTDTTRVVLHEVMEQQTVSVAKAGIICSLNARTSILASANPVHSKYNPRLSVVDNIQLPPTLLSRFDLIYLILDKPDIERDRRLAQHLVSLYFPTPAVPNKSTTDTLLDTNTLTEYIAFARRHVHPVITNEAFEALVEGYVQMRRIGMARDTTGSAGTNTIPIRSRGTITATPRQLEGLIRLSEAVAKIRLSSEVTAEDVKEALRLTRLALLQAATDPRSGLLDIDLITIGRSQSDRNRLTQLAEALRLRLEEERSRIRTTEDLYHSLIQHVGPTVPISYEDYKAALHLLVEEEVIALSGDPHHQNIILLSTVTGVRKGWTK
jgi:DNA replication licensing factor MCM4